MMLASLSLPAYRLGLLSCLLVLSGCGDSGSSSFDWSVTPDRSQVQPGQEAVYTISVASKVNINSSVALRVEGVPNGATAALDPQVMPDTATSSTLRVQTTAGLSVGTYTLKVFAQEAGQSEVERNVLLVVASNSDQADFSLEVDPADYTFANIEAGKTFTYYVRPLNSFQGTVTTTLSGLTDDLVMSQAPNPPSVTIGPTGGAGGTFVIRVQPVPPVPSPVDITVTSTSGSITHTRNIRITIPQ